MLLAVLLAAAGPDEGVAFAAFIVEEVGVDWGAEARIIQLDRDIISPFGGTFGPATVSYTHLTLPTKRIV